MGQPTPPAVGRMVHYVSYGTPKGEYTSQCRTATITEVGAWVAEATVMGKDGKTRTVYERWDAEACALIVQNPTGQFFNTCRHAEPDGNDRQGGTWHWPERT